ncbi:hypothetical protein RhiJN_11144 [Ceratobasidium sp. AG-Ba]|nr:hypothetical protein RhiJN_11144 [Ceratobasidium sp. AG-Ba]
MIVLPFLLAAFAAFINMAYLASHPDSFASEMAAYTVLGASSASVVKPAMHMAMGYISSLVSNHPTSFNLPGLLASNLSFGVIATVPTVSRPVGWRSAAPVFFDRDARISVGWELYGLPRLSAIPFSKLLYPSGSRFLRQDLFRSGRHLVYDWVDASYDAKHSGTRQAGELALLFGRCANLSGQLTGIPQYNNKRLPQAWPWFTTNMTLGFTPTGLNVSGFKTHFNLALVDPVPSQYVTEGCSNMGLPRVIRIPARPGSHFDVRFGWMMEVRTTVMVLIWALFMYQVCMDFGTEDTKTPICITPPSPAFWVFQLPVPTNTPDTSFLYATVMGESLSSLHLLSPADVLLSKDIDDSLLVKLPSIAPPSTSERAGTPCYDNLSGRAVNSTIYKSCSGSVVSSDSNMSLASICGGISFADSHSRAGENAPTLPDIAQHPFTFAVIDSRISPFSSNEKLGKVMERPIEGSENVELRPAKRLRLDSSFAAPTEDVSADQTMNAKTAIGEPLLDVHQVFLPTVDTRCSNLLPGHTQGVTVAHEEPAVPVRLDTELDSSRTFGPQALSASLPEPTTSASALVLSQARGRLLLRICEDKCDPDKIRARILAAKRASAPTRSGSASKVLCLVIRRQQSGTMKGYQRDLVMSGQVLNLAVAHTLSSRQPPGYSGTRSLSGYSPVLQSIPESRRYKRERR